MRRITGLTLTVALSITIAALPQDLPVNQVMDTIVCIDDPGYSYALYLPPYYGDFKEWPVIYAFDPDARGRIPVERYKEAAERFGYIVVGSNDSRNGPWEPIFRSAQAMFKDTRKRFLIDPNRVHLSGFSGGSRIASTIGMKNGKIAGVIGCGAGFDQGHPPNYHIDFDYYGLIGNLDFNYQEMKSLEMWLSMFDMKQEIAEFEGGHDWPPSKNLVDAITWMEFRAMEDERRALRNDLIREFIETREQLALDALARNDPYKAYRAYRDIIDYIGELADTREYKERADQLLKDRRVKQHIKNIREVRLTENDLIREYRDAFRGYRSIDYEFGVTIQPMSFWKSKVREARKFINRGDTPLDSLMGHRLIDYIWRTAFMLYEAVNHTDEHMLVPTYLEIWTIARPDHATPLYYLARYYSELGERRKSVKYLEKAVERGFDQVHSLESDTSFSALIDTAPYQRFLRKNGFMPQEKTVDDTLPNESPGE